MFNFSIFRILRLEQSVVNELTWSETKTVPQWSSFIRWYDDAGFR